MPETSLRDMRNLLSCCLVFILSAGTAFAQEKTALPQDNDDDPYDSKSYFMFGFNYLSNNVYLGRKDTVTIPYYTPYISYHNKNGIYVKGLVSYTTAKGGAIDLTTIEARDGTIVLATISAAD